MKLTTRQPSTLGVNAPVFIASAPVLPAIFAVPAEPASRLAAAFPLYSATQVPLNVVGVAVIVIVMDAVLAATAHHIATLAPLVVSFTGDAPTALQLLTVSEIVGVEVPSPQAKPHTRRFPVVTLFVT